MIRAINANINKVFLLGQSFVNEKLKQYGLSSGLFYFILALADRECMTMQELSRAVNVDNGYTSRIINKLIELKYIKKEQNPKDARSSIVYLTDEGRKVSETVKLVMLDWINLITNHVAPDDIIIVNKVFDTFYNNAREYYKGRIEDGSS